MNTLSRFEQLSVTAALKKMFDGSYFNICTIDRCLDVTGIKPNKRDYDALSALHCVNWGTMDPELRDMTFGVVMSMFQNGSGFNTEQITENLFKAEAISHVRQLSK